MKISFKEILYLSIVTIILVAIYFTLPTPDILGSYSASLDGLTFSQRRNICLVGRKINNIYLEPGSEFSFNKYVGPRTFKNGFLPSKSLFEGEVINSIGGGICLASSTLYNAAIRSNLKITKRTAHTSLIKSVPIGLDATVWYGVNDLKFLNNTQNKVKVEAGCSYNRFNVTIKGKHTADKPDILVNKFNLSHSNLEVF
jgi:vancomycin resistance protein VanW